MIRLAYLVSHPIQYQAPLLRKIAAESDFDLHVLFMRGFSTGNYFDKGFGREIKWDVPLLEGYSHEFLPTQGDAAADSSADVRNVGLSKVFTKDRFDVLWSHGYAHRTNVQALILARRLGIPSVVRSENQRNAVDRVGKMAFVKEAVVRQVLKLPSAFGTIGSQNADYYRSLGVPDEKMFLVPYAIDNDRFRNQALDAAPTRDAFRAELGLEPGRPIILFASKLMTRKKAADLIAAWRKLVAKGGPPPYLLIVGDGEERPAIEASLTDADRESVKMLGFQNQSQLPRFFDLCDVFVLPSAREQWGLVVNEVMCAGKAVIVTNEVGSGADLIRSGENGHIYNVGDIDALANSLADVLSSPERSAAMGQKSWEIVREWNFDADIKGLRAAIDYATKGRRA